MGGIGAEAGGLFKTVFEASEHVVQHIGEPGEFIVGVGPGDALVKGAGGQAVLALAEEIYFRGLLLSEIERLAPRLGVRRPIVRRWVALLLTATLFGMEHLMLTPSAADMGRRMFFTVAMGLLFGLLVMVSANLQLAAGIHTWINWLLLGAVPYFTDSAGRSIIPAGLYIGSTLIFAFIAVFILQELRSRHKLSPVRH